jgi:hypothetical protein
MSSLTTTLAASITASHSDIHARRPATFCSCALCSLRLHPAANQPYPTVYQARPPDYLPQHTADHTTTTTILLSLSSHIPTDWERPCELTDSPTHRHQLPFTHHQDRTLLNPNPTRPIADVIDNRASQTPPGRQDTTYLSQHRNNTPLLTYR